MQPELLAGIVERAMKTAVDPLVTEIVALRERVAAVEGRALVPGPAGEKGATGERGADGLGFEHLNVTLEDRTLAFTFQRNAEVKSFPLVLPTPIYRGTFQYGMAYQIGDVITHDGSSWHCQTPTQLPPKPGLTEWKLMVKRGQAGKDAPAP